MIKTRSPEPLTSDGNNEVSVRSEQDSFKEHHL